MRMTGNLLLAAVIGLASVPRLLAAENAPADAIAPANLSSAEVRVLELEVRIRQLEERLARMEAAQAVVPTVQYVQAIPPIFTPPQVIPAPPPAELGEEINGIKFRVFMLGGGEQGKQTTFQSVIGITR